MFELFCKVIWKSIPKGIKRLSGLLFLEWIVLFLICNGDGRQMLVIAAIGLLPFYMLVVLMSIIDGEEK